MKRDMWSSSYTIMQRLINVQQCHMFGHVFRMMLYWGNRPISSWCFPKLCGYRVCIASVCTNWGLNRWCSLWSLNSYNLTYQSTEKHFFCILGCGFDVVYFWAFLNSDANKDMKQLDLSKPTVMGWVTTIKNISLFKDRKMEGVKVARTS